MSKQKQTKQNRIRLVEPFCAEFSAPSEMPPVDRELFF